MSIPVESSRPARDPWRPLRYLVRIPLLLVHVVFAILIAALLASATLANIGGSDDRRLGKRLIRWWSATLLRICGFRIRASGTPLSGAVLFVANHISWLDIVLLHSQRAVHFVAKSEIARWPLVGWLATRGGTIFHRRGNTDSLAAVMARVVVQLRAGEPVGVFPEGGSGHGTRVGTFHARIFQTALDAEVPVQPVALRYGRGGVQHPDVPFGVKESFFTNFLRILGNAPMDAEIHFLEPVAPTPDARRLMAEESRRRIVAVLGYGD